MGHAALAVVLALAGATTVAAQEPGDAPRCADPTLQAMIVDLERMFWNCVQNGEPPQVVSTRDAIRRWGRLSVPGRVMAGEAEIDAIDELRALREQKAQIDQQEEKAKTTVLAALGELGDTLIGPNGDTLATWRMDNGRKAFTVAAREPSRRLLIK